MIKKNNKIRYVLLLFSIGFLSTFIFSISNSINSLNHFNDPSINNQLNSTSNSQIRTTNSPATYIDVEALITNFPNDFNQKQYVYNVSQDEVKKVIYKYVKNPPGGFLFNNIQFDKRAQSGGWEVNGDEGTIKTTIILNKFINDNGQEQSTQFPPVEVTFRDFYPAPGVTSAKESINVEAPNSLPQDVYSNQKIISKYIEDNNVVSNIPITSEIKLSNFKFSNSDGFVSMDIAIDGYFESDINGNFIFYPQTRILVRDFKIYGFKNLTKTSIVDSILVPDVSNILPSSFSNNISDIKNIIFNNMTSKPPTMLPDDILINQVTPQNSVGKLVINYSCSNIYDEVAIANTANANGKDIVLVSSITQRNAIYLTGFTSALPTVFPESIPSIGSEEKLAQTLTDDEIIDYLLNSIVDINNIGITKKNINVNNKQVDNINGIIIVYPKLDKYVTASGFLYDIPGEFIEFPPVTISGFKTVSPTKLITNPNFNGDSSILPTDALKDIDIVKNIIKKNLTGLPDDFSNENIIILNSSPNNKAGILTISFTLDNFYDSSGFLIKNQSWPIQLISMRGFKIIEPTIIRKQITINDVSNIAPYQYTDEQLIAFIKDNINLIVNPLPNGFSVDNNVIVQQINRYNTDGYIEAFIKINYYYDSLGNVVTDDVIYSNIRFNGFASIIPTSINNEVFLTSVSNISSADVDENKLKDLLFDDSDPNNPTSLLIQNFPKNGLFTKDNIFIRIVDRISTNSESYMIIDVSLNTYYNHDGFLVQNSNFLLEKTNIKINGFKKIEPTKIVDSYRIPSSSEYSEVYPSDIAIWTKDSNNDLSIEKLIKDNLNSFLTSFPPEITIKNILVKNIINSTGTIIIDLQVLNYYNSIGKTENSIVLSNVVSISGFKAVGSTIVTSNFNVSNVDHILASSFTTDQLLDVIWENKDFIFTNLPSNFVKNDIEIIFEKNSINNLAGEINAGVILHNYYDTFGTQQTVIPYKTKVIFSGFKSILPTRIISNVSINKPGINKILPSDFSNKDLLQYIYEARNSIFVNLPDEFNINSIVFNTNNVKRNNLTGQILIEPLSINVFYDDAGSLINNDGSLLSSSLTISGFGSISVSTTIEDDVNVKDTNYSSFLPTDITIEMLKNIIIQKSIIKNKAPNFSILDIVSSDGDIKERNNLTGEIILEVKIKNYYNEKGVVVNDLDNTLNHLVKFKGFKNAIPTTANDTTLSSLNSIIASNVTDNQLLQIIRKNYNYIFVEKSLPDAFSETNIYSVDKISHNNLTGSIDCRIGINRYYDERASLVSNGLIKYINVKISGFSVLNPTKLIKNNISVVNQNKLASDLSINEAVQIIYDNASFIFDSLPIDFIQNNIEINDLSPNNTLGQTDVDFSLNYYINKEGEFIKTSENPSYKKLNFNIKIQGFNVVAQTKIKNSYNVSGQIANILPSNIKANDIIRLISNDPSNFIENPFLGSTNIALDIIVSNLRPNNLNGSLTFNLSLLKYYDERGLLVTEANGGKILSKDFVLNGFLQQQKTEFFGKVFVNKEDIYQIPQLIKNKELANIIFENKDLFFVNLPNSFLPNDITVESIENINNLTGSLDAIVRITNFFNEDGILEKNEFYKYKVSISGFKKIQPTKIVDSILITNFSSIQNNIASYFFNNPNVLENLITINRRNIFFNMPPYFEDQSEFKKVLNINPISYNNAEGYIDVEIIIDEYYASNGELITNQNVLSKKVRISGFTPSFATKITTDTITVQDASNYTFPSEVSIEEIEYIIKNQYPDFLSQLPQNFNASNIVNIKKINANDINGTIIVGFSLNLYYNNDGVIVSNGELFNGQITISGFNYKKSSVFIDRFGKPKALGSFDKEIIVTNLPNVFPSQIDKYYSVQDPNSSLTLEQQKENVNNWLFDLVKSKLENIENMTKENIFVQFREKIFSDQDGYIEVSVKILSYISIVEGGLTNTPVEFVLKIDGLKQKITSTEVKNNTLVIVISVLSVATAIAIVSFLIFIFRFRIWRR